MPSEVAFEHFFSVVICLLIDLDNDDNRNFNFFWITTLWQLMRKKKDVELQCLNEMGN